MAEVAQEQSTYRLTVEKSPLPHLYDYRGRKLRWEGALGVSGVYADLAPGLYWTCGEFRSSTRHLQFAVERIEISTDLSENPTVCIFQKATRNSDLRAPIALLQAPVWLEEQIVRWVQPWKAV